MTKEHESNLEHENLNESSNESTGKFKMPWNSKFGEDENFNNRQYSRTARNQPVREATTLSKVLLFMLVCACIVPFAIYFWVGSNKGKEPVQPKTASQVAISRAENASSASSASSVASSSSTANSESTSSGATSVTTNSVQTSSAVASERRTQDESEPQQQQQQQQPQQQQQTGGSYVVQAGDSWYSIATRHGISVYDLAAANGIGIDATILPGQTIVIP